MPKLARKFAPVLLLATFTVPPLPVVSTGARSQHGAPEKGREPAVTGSNLNNAAPPTLGPVDPYVVASGGGTSSGSRFSVDGTIGQAAAGTQLSASTLTVSSGFWNSASGSGAGPKKRRGQTISQ
jgi:hypothetical protein